MAETINIEQELYKHFGLGKDFTLCTAIAKRFYEMGRKQQESVSDDLDAEIENFVYTLPHNAIGDGPLDKHYDDPCVKEARHHGWRHTWDFNHIVDIARHFANWQKEQLTKDSIEATVTNRPNDFGEYRPIVIVPVSSSCNIGDKVKIVVIKSE